MSAQPNHFQSRKTHCPQGHPFSGDNVKWYVHNGYRCRSCRTCINERQRKAKFWRREDQKPKNRARQKAWRLLNLDYVRERNFAERLKRKYDITPEQYNEMLAAQNGVCGICKNAAGGDLGTNHGRLHVDHDHATGKIRGLLCFSCNRSLGGFRDSRELLMVAHQYLVDAEKNH